jgi:hypothetical protein
MCGYAICFQIVTLLKDWKQLRHPVMKKWLNKFQHIININKSLKNICEDLVKNMDKRIIG